MFSTKSTEVKQRYEGRSTSCSNCGAYVTSDSFFCQVCGSEVTSEIFSTDHRLETFKGYIQIIGIVEIVLGIFELIGGLVLTLLVPLVYYAVSQESPSDLYIVRFVSIFLFGLALLLYIFALATIISGRKLMQHKNSGRIGTMIIGVLNLFNVPFGTVFGLAALYVLTQPEVIDLYAKS